MVKRLSVSQRQLGRSLILRILAIMSALCYGFQVSYLKEWRLITTMSLTQEDVRKIAHLARIEVADSDLPAMASNLGRILAFVDQLNAAEVGDVKPMAHPLDTAVQRMRADEVTEVNEREKLQAIAPEVTAGLYTVPRVME
jgi:aspartyl-tRNA(Asn)/glutamyl-tRNA(Gln) amidotransferase subunit C